MPDKRRERNRSFFSVAGLMLVLLILVMVNVIFAKANLRWDATEDQLYSLSDSTTPAKNVPSAGESPTLVIKTAMEMGMSLSEIEQYLDWLDLMRSLGMPPSDDDSSSDGD